VFSRTTTHDSRAFVIAPGYEAKRSGSQHGWTHNNGGPVVQPRQNGGNHQLGPVTRYSLRKALQTRALPFMIFTDNGARDVMFKLLAFTAAMVILPLGTYWFSLNYIFQGISTASNMKLMIGYNYTKAGITAIAAAHGVLFLYIYVAIKEDSEDRQLKKDQ
jgi:hypothetical protein